MRVFYCIAIILLTLGTPVCAWAQAVKKEARGSITGRVTIEGEAASGIRVELYPSQFLSISRTPVAETIADQNGRFRLEGLNGGTYRIAPLSPDCFITDETDGQRNKIVAIKDGEAIEGADIALSRGAVITGRVLDADGEPIIAGIVSLSSITEYSLDLPGTKDPRMFRNFIPTTFFSETDDRGLYRIYGLPAGRYTVGAKIAVQGDSSKARQSFYPNLTDEKQAVVIEIRAGSVYENIDIIFQRRELPPPSFKASGRIVNGEDGKPAAFLPFNYREITDGGKNDIGLGFNLQTDSKGVFQIKDLAPGRYVAYAQPEGRINIYSETVEFEVVDSDVKGLEIKVHAGASLSGTVMLNGDQDQYVLDNIKFQGFLALGSNEEKEKQFRLFFNPGLDSSFKIFGLPPGKIRLVSSNYPMSMGLNIVRIERNGVDQKDGIDVAPGEQVTGVRIVLDYYKGAIIGQVKIESSNLAQHPNLHVILVSLNHPEFPQKTMYIDQSFSFKFENVPPDDYEVQLSTTNFFRRQINILSKQTVTVTEQRPVNVLFVLNQSQLENNNEKIEEYNGDD